MAILTSFLYNNIIHPSPKYRHIVSKFGLTLCSVVLWRFRSTLGFGPGPGFGPSVGLRGSTPRFGPGTGPRPGGGLWLATPGGSGLRLGFRLGLGPGPWPGSGVGAGPGTAVVVAAPGSGTAPAPGAAAASSATSRAGWTTGYREKQSAKTGRAQMRRKLIVSSYYSNITEARAK